MPVSRAIAAAVMSRLAPSVAVRRLGRRRSWASTIAAAVPSVATTMTIAACAGGAVAARLRPSSSPTGTASAELMVAGCRRV